MKPDFNNIPAEVEWEIAEALTIGTEKHDGLGKDKTEDEYYTKCRRHLAQYKMGEEYDKETGIRHVTAFICDAIILLHIIKRREDGGLKMDSRGRSLHNGTMPERTTPEKYRKPV